MKKNGLLIITFFLFSCIHAEDGYRLWLRYDRIDNSQLLQQYSRKLSSIWTITKRCSFHWHRATAETCKQLLHDGTGSSIFTYSKQQK